MMAALAPIAIQPAGRETLLPSARPRPAGGELRNRAARQAQASFEPAAAEAELRAFGEAKLAGRRRRAGSRSGPARPAAFRGRLRAAPEAGRRRRRRPGWAGPSGPDAAPRPRPAERPAGSGPRRPGRRSAIFSSHSPSRAAQQRGRFHRASSIQGCRRRRPWMWPRQKKMRAGRTAAFALPCSRSLD